MSAAAKLIGGWGADLERFADVNPEMAELGDMLEDFLGGMSVEFTADTLVIDGYGGGRKERSYTVRESGDTTAVIECRRASAPDEVGVYEIEFIDGDRINMILTQPVQDAMALKRTG